VPPDGPTLLYFAYGSNMSTPRLLGRAASARVITVAQLSGHVLRFHKRGRDGSAKCDARFTGLTHDVVNGVVFEIDADEKPRLDEQEGLGKGYGEKRVTVTDTVGGCYRVFTYYATHIDATLRPYHWYREHVLRGATEHVLPEAYVATIRAVESVDDPVACRQDSELSIYGD